MSNSQIQVTIYVKFEMNKLYQKYKQDFIDNQDVQSQYYLF